MSSSLAAASSRRISLDWQVSPPQRPDQPCLPDLAAPVTAVARRRADVRGDQQPGLVIMPEGVYRYATEPGESPDRHEVRIVHNSTMDSRVTRRSRSAPARHICQARGVTVVTQVREGTGQMADSDALAAAFEQHRDHLHAVAYRLLGSASDADDAVQDTWLRMSGADVSAVDNLAAWLTTVVARVSLNMLRSRRREQPAASPGLRPLRRPPPAGPPDGAARGRRTRSARRTRWSWPTQSGWPCWSFWTR